MGADEIGTEQAQFLEEGHRPLAPGLHHEFVLARDRAEMGVEADAMLSRQFAEPTERLRSQAVRSVRRDSTGNPAVGSAVPVLEQILGLFEPLFNKT